MHDNLHKHYLTDEAFEERFGIDPHDQSHLEVGYHDNEVAKQGWLDGTLLSIIDGGDVATGWRSVNVNARIVIKTRVYDKDGFLLERES